MGGSSSNGGEEHQKADQIRREFATRFPPEPNGYLHIGHAKSICLNFGLARDFSGRCHLRFDDTNPAKEDQEYVDAIIEMVRWLGFQWDEGRQSESLLTQATISSSYISFAQYLIRLDFAYVDSQSADEMRASRGNLTEPGIDSPYRNRGADESLKLFRRNASGPAS